MKQSECIYFPQTYPENILIKHIWKISKSDFGIEKEKILPKGTAEIIFNLSTNILCFKESEKTTFSFHECNINGLNTSPIHLIKNESQTFIGIQLHVYALKYLFGIPAREFTNQVFNGFDICPSLKEVFERLRSDDSFEGQVNTIIHWVKISLMKNQDLNKKCLIFDLHNRQDLESQSVTSICRQYNVSDRHLRRLSYDYIGMNTEDFILYRKYLTSLFHIHNQNHSLTTIGYESGFYDQAHFIREFKSFTGLTPGAYRKQMSDFPGHLYLQNL